MQDIADGAVQKLSLRLQAAADFVTHGSRVADVGTDHGHLPIYLIQCGKCPCAVAMDIRQGPLQRAKEHIADAGLCDNIKTRLSDGMQGLLPGEADSIVIAGMGGMTIIQILSASSGLLPDLKELILAPQSDIAKVRRFLRERGLVIDRENLVWEDGKFYPIMHVVTKKAFTNADPHKKIREGICKKLAENYLHSDGLEEICPNIAGPCIQHGEQNETGSKSAEEYLQPCHQEEMDAGEHMLEKQVTAHFQQMMDQYGEYMVYAQHPMLRAMLERDEQQLGKILLALEKKAKSEESRQRRLEVEGRLRDVRILLEEFINEQQRNEQQRNEQ